MARSELGPETVKTNDHALVESHLGPGIFLNGVNNLYILQKRPVRFMWHIC